MPVMPKNVLITGGGGFLGGHFASEFAAAGWRVEGVGRSGRTLPLSGFERFDIADVGDLEAIRSIIERSYPEVIVHLAAPASVPASITDSLADYQAHAGPTVALLEAIRRSGAMTRLILVSSAAVYGNPTTLPVDECAPLSPISPYGFHKMQQDLLIDEYVALHGARACKVRLFSTYGENLRRLAIWEITRRALARNPEVLGTGDETRDYLYGADIGRAIVCIAERAEFRGEAINVGSGQEVSISALAQTIFALTGFDALPRFTGIVPAGSPSRWRADTHRLRALGWVPAEWSGGLPRTIEWIRDAANHVGDL